mgnify:CR=1 FL=1
MICYVRYMKDDRISKRIIQKNARGKKPRGNPRNRWVNQIKQDTVLKIKRESGY